MLRVCPLPEKFCEGQGQVHQPDVHKAQFFERRQAPEAGRELPQWDVPDSQNPEREIAKAGGQRLQIV